jgi:hypothetical protein
VRDWKLKLAIVVAMGFLGVPSPSFTLLIVIIVVHVGAEIQK